MSMEERYRMIVSVQREPYWRGCVIQLAVLRARRTVHSRPVFYDVKYTTEVAFWIYAVLCLLITGSPFELLYQQDQELFRGRAFRAGTLPHSWY